MARGFVTNKYIQLSSAIVTSLPITFGCWWRPADTSTQSEFFYLGDRYDNANWIALGSRSDGSDFRARLRVADDGSHGYVWGGILDVDTWYHVVGRLASSTDQDIFTDGSKVDGNTGKDPSAKIARVTIGRLGDSSPSNQSNGDVAEAFIYDVALTDAEINALAAGYSPLFIRPASLQAHWPLLRDEDTDLIGGYDLTAYNTPTVEKHAPVIYRTDALTTFSAAAEPPAGSPIPVFMHHYRQQGMT